jgi:hypothetical protein
VVVHAGNQQGEEDEAGGSWVRGQPGLQNKNKQEKEYKIKPYVYSQLTFD